MKVAIIGYGYWGRNVLLAVLKSDFFELACVFDEDYSQIQAAKQIYDFQEYSSFEAILKDRTIEAVMIITPPQTHFSLAKQALEAHKHTFVEKPLSTSLQECQILYDLAHQQHCILHCDHIFLYSPAVQWLKAHLQDFGEIIYLQARRINLGLFQTNVDVIWDLAIHDLAILDYLFGLEIISHHTLRTHYRHFCALADIHLELKNPNANQNTNNTHINANINVSWLSPIKVRELIIGGEKKTAIYDETKKDKITLFDCGIVISEEFEKDNLYKKMVQYHLGDITYPSLDSRAPLENSIQKFQDQITTDSIDIALQNHTLRVIKGLEIISY